LIAGGGEFPLIFAREARKKGARIIAFAIKEMALPQLEEACDRVHWLSIGQIKKFIFLLMMERIKKIVMLGKVDKSIIYSSIQRDEKATELLTDFRDKNDYTILERITAELAKRGIEVINGIEYMDDLFPKKGTLTGRCLSGKESDDVLFGFGVAKEVARLDIGQTIVVKDKAIVSVEAMEGTNAAIERAAGLCGEGFVVIKVSRPQQDMRWDVPVVGPDTIELIARLKGNVLAVEEKRLFFLEREACIRIADKNNISISVI